MLSDTSPEAEKVQIELLRRATVAERFAMMESLTTMTINLSRRAIARANPELTPEELNLKWVELNYGKELADNVREYIKGLEADS